VTGATKEDFGVRARRMACSCAAGKCGPRRQRAIGCFCFTTCQTIG
jgi:hypothetical protein